MSAVREVARPDPSPGELETLRREHGNSAQLLLALESHLALMSAGGGHDLGLMLDAVRYLVDYVGRLHHADGEELCRRLERASAVERSERRDLARFGFSYCSELRRSMLLEEAELLAARSAIELPALDQARSAGEERHRARFEALTQRMGCDCAYARSV
ncbi:hypothetical protein BH11MYX4_BH11MYX4_19230 [soil metagenome]